MYFRIVSQCIQSLRNVETWLDKAEHSAAAKKFDADVLAAARLAPDMQPLTGQLQSACYYVVAAAAWLSGQKPPTHEDNEKSMSELRARIAKTIAFAESVTKEQYKGAASQTVSISWKPGKIIAGEDYIVQMTIPNVYFHLVMVYAILRHNGVDVGKMDYLGPMNFVAA